MAWEISHTRQAWANVEARLRREWTREQLADALCDDKFEHVYGRASQEHAERAAKSFRLRLLQLPHDVLVDEVMHTIEEHNTCSNGGHEFWIDREGYHTVPCVPPDTGSCGACKCNTELVREIPEKGQVELACGCNTIVEIWTLPDSDPDPCED